MNRTTLKKSFRAHALELSSNSLTKSTHFEKNILHLKCERSEQRVNALKGKIKKTHQYLNTSIFINVVHKMADQQNSASSDSKQTLSEQLSVRFAEESDSTKTNQRPTKQRPAPLNLPTDIELTRQDSVKRSPFITPQNSIQPMDLNKKMAEIMNDGCYTGLGNPPIMENNYGENIEKQWENDNTGGTGDWNDFSIPAAVNEIGSFPERTNFGMEFAKTPGNSHFPSAIGGPIGEITNQSD